jgi:hypothetical protein
MCLIWTRLIIPCWSRVSRRARAVRWTLLITYSPRENAYATMLTTVTMSAQKRETYMNGARSVVISMRLPLESGARLKRMATRHGWTPSDASARLVEEGLRRSEFAFIDFRDSPAGRQAYIQGSTLAVWEVLLLVHSYRADAGAVAKHLKWPEAKVRAAVNYAEAFPEEINVALSENANVDFAVLKRMLPQAVKLASSRARKLRDGQTSSR